MNRYTLHFSVLIYKDIMHINTNHQKHYVLQDHVIVAVFAEEDSPLIGLRNLVMPLRASNVPYTDLLQVVLVGNVEYIRRKY